MIDVVISIRSHEPLGQLLARWAGVLIVPRIVDEVMAREEAALGCAGGVRLGDARQGMPSSQARICSPLK
jgi:hypothetical protein